MRVVGLSDVLPLCIQLPIDAVFHVDGDAITYRILVGSDDETWRALTESKRWKAVYLYATEKSESVWNWNNPIEGLLDA